MAARHGFTLIELLVSVFLTSIVVLAAYALVRSSSASLQGEIDNRVLDGNLENASQIMGRDLSRVGYHVPFDSRSGDSRRIMGVNHELTGIRSLNYVGRSVSSAGKSVAEIKLVIDVTDHDGYEVLSDVGGVLTLQKATKSFLTLSDVLGMPDSPTNSFTFNQRAMEVSMANASFERAFRYAKAVYVKSNKTGDRILLMLKRGGSLVNGRNVSAANTALGTIEYSPTDKPSTKSLQDYGFDNPSGLMVGEKVSPIVSIVYRYNNGNLERCYARDLSSTTENHINNDSLDTCSVIVKNISYFELYPITDVSLTGGERGSFIRYLRNTCTGVCANTATIGGAANFQNLNTVDVSKVIGFYYRIGAYGDQKIPGGRVDGVQPNVISVTDSEGNVHFHPHSNVQGTVTLKNHISLSGDTVKCTGSNCNLKY